MQEILDDILLLNSELKQRGKQQTISVLGLEYSVDFVRFIGTGSGTMIQFKCTYTNDSSLFYFYASKDFTRGFHTQLKANVEQFLATL